MTFLLELRNAAMVTSNPDLSYALRGAADSLDAALDDLYEEPTVTNMQDVNGLWSYATRLLDVASKDPSLPSNGGKMVVPQQERKAV